MGARDGRGQRLRLAQQGAEIVPDQLVELAGGGVARGAARGAVREGAVPLAAAQIVEVPPVDGPRRAGEAAVAAAHQRAQQVLVRRVVPPREGAVGRQLGLHLVEVRLAHHGGHLPNEEPGVGRLRHGRAMGPADRVRRRAAMGGRAVLRALRIDLARVGRVAQDAPDRRARPARPARGRGHAARIQVHGELHQRGARARGTGRTARQRRRPRPGRCVTPRGSRGRSGLRR